MTYLTCVKTNVSLLGILSIIRYTYI
jgi:hypothetical protein